MKKSHDSWDSLYPEILNDVHEGGSIHESRTNPVTEIIGYEFTLTNPRTRCLQNESYPFNVFASLGHWLWYMSGRMDYQFISYYNPRASEFTSDEVRHEGAYGPRISGIGSYNQIENVISLIENTNQTRRALIPIFIPSFEQPIHKLDNDYEDEVPCPVALHCIPRDGKLSFITYMRSQDVFRLLPLDLFSFTLIQEYVSSSISLDLGDYHHYAGSLHYHQSNTKELRDVIDEDYPQKTPEMPAMPEKTPRQYLTRVLEIEEQIRVYATSSYKSNNNFPKNEFLGISDELPEFWSEITKMLIFLALFKLEDARSMEELAPEFHRSLSNHASRSIQILEDDG